MEGGGGAQGSPHSSCVPLPPSILSWVQLSAQAAFGRQVTGTQVRRSRAALSVETEGAGGCNSRQQRLFGVSGAIDCRPETPARAQQAQGPCGMEALPWTLRGKAGPQGSQAWPPLDGKSALRQRRAQLSLPSAQDTVSVGDMPTACWIKKMGSNWILPFYFKFSWILMEWITAHTEWRGRSISEEEMDRHHMAQASPLGGAGPETGQGKDRSESGASIQGSPPTPASVPSGPPREGSSEAGALPALTLGNLFTPGPEALVSGCRCS